MINYLKLIIILAIRNIKWVIIKLKAKRGRIVRRVQGSNMILDLSGVGLDLKEDNIFKQLALDNIREKEATNIMKSLIKPGDNILEIGANIGYYALMEASLIQGRGIIYVLEPEPENFKLLEENIKLNNYSNIKLYNMAIGDKVGDFPFYVSDKSNLHTMVNSSQKSIKAIKVHTTTIDRFLRDKDDVNLIRMDIEGYECNALMGMKETLSKNKDIVLFIEIHPHLVRYKKMKKFLETLKKYGFESSKVISHDSTLRNILGHTKVEELSIEELIKDDRVKRGLNAFEIFFERRS